MYNNILLILFCFVQSCNIIQNKKNVKKPIAQYLSIGKNELIYKHPINQAIVLELYSDNSFIIAGNFAIDIFSNGTTTCLKGHYIIKKDNIQLFTNQKQTNQDVSFGNTQRYHDLRFWHLIRIQENSYPHTNFNHRIIYSDANLITDSVGNVFLKRLDSTRLDFGLYKYGTNIFGIDTVLNKPIAISEPYDPEPYNGLGEDTFRVDTTWMFSRLLGIDTAYQYKVGKNDTMEFHPILKLTKALPKPFFKDCRCPDGNFFNEIPQKAIEAYDKN